MTTYCQSGEKAYLRIDGSSEVWEFDGPITVENRQKPGETTYPANLGFVTVNYWIVYPPDQNGVQFEQFIGAYGVPDFKNAFSLLTQAPNPPTDPWPRYFLALQTNTQQSITVARRQTVTTTAANNYTALVPASESYHSGRVSVVKDGVIVQPITIPGGYELVVNGSVIKTSSDPIEYSVKCGDRCPPGEKWNEECQSCCPDDDCCAQIANMIRSVG